MAAPPAFAPLGRPLRVAMPIQAFAPQIGGAERQIERLAPRLGDRGVEVTVITRRPPGTAARERRDGLMVERLPTPRRGAGLAFTFAATARAAAIRPDLIHAHGLLSPASAAIMAGAMTSAPVAVKVLASGPEGSLDRLMSRRLGRLRLRWLTREARAFITLARESEAELADAGVPAEALVRIPNGVDTDHFRPPAEPLERRALRERLGVGVGEPLVIYCGRFEPVKRVPDLIRLFRRQPHGRLLIAGTGSERAAVEAAAAARDDGRVTVVDPVEDTSELLRAADLYLSASIREGMSGSVLEAMASGLPVAAAPAGGMNDLLGGGCGRLLPAHDPEGAAAVIAELLDDEPQRRRLGEAARRRAVTELSLEATADRLASLYRSLVAHPGRTP